MGVDLELAVAALAASCDPPGPGADGRMRLRFDAALFHERWGGSTAAHSPTISASTRRGRGRDSSAGRGRRSLGGGPRDQASEWAAFELARSLDKAAACEATALGFLGLLGASYVQAGYASAAEMLDAFASSERFQVLAFFDLLAGRGAGSRQAEALRQRDLEAFAVLHAGPGAAPATRSPCGRRSPHSGGCARRADSRHSFEHARPTVERIELPAKLCFASRRLLRQAPDDDGPGKRRPVRHPRQSRWLDELGRLKGGRPA